MTFRSTGSSGEANFFVDILKSSSNKIGYQVKLDFSLVQHRREKILMESFVNYFNSGGSYVNKESVRYIASKFLDIQEIIIPFF